VRILFYDSVVGSLSTHCRTPTNTSVRVGAAIFGADRELLEMDLCSEGDGEQTFMDNNPLVHQVTIFTSKRRLISDMNCSQATAEIYKSRYSRTESIPVAPWVPSTPSLSTAEDNAVVGPPVETEQVYVYTAEIQLGLVVRHEEYYAVAFEICNMNKDIVGSVDGAVVFKNPYGYVSAETYGLIPFEVG
jgi:hypothetical protein